MTTTPIQEAALPLALRGKDVAGQSQTGTGKTAAFLIAAFTRCCAHPRPPPSGPTRAARADHRADPRAGGADRVRRAAARRFTPASGSSPVYGGIDYTKQREALRDGCDLLVGTPGRLIDYLKQHVVVAGARSRCSSSTRPTGCSTWASSPTSASSCGALPAAGAAAVVPVLGHAVLPGAGADLGVHEQSGPDHDHAPAEDGRAGRAGALPRRPRGEVRPAARAARAARAAAAS